MAPQTLLYVENTHMGWTVLPPQFNEVTGEYIGEPIVENREMQRGINTVSYEDIDPNEYNDALEPHYARRAAEANLPIFDENASDADVVAFWRNPNPLSEAEVDAIMSAYVATDNESIANLLQWKITGDESFLSEEQRYQLGLDDQQDFTPDEEEYSDDELADLEGWLIDNTTDPNPEVAQAILDANIGDSNEAVTIQHLAYQYYNGQITLEQAYNEALNTGLPQSKLYAAFNSLYNQMNANV
jgi:hypothetical protein